MQFQIGTQLRLRDDRSVPEDWRGIVVTVVDTITTTKETKDDLLAEAPKSGACFFSVVVRRDDGQQISVDVGALIEL